MYADSDQNETQIQSDLKRAVFSRLWSEAEALPSLEREQGSRVGSLLLPKAREWKPCHSSSLVPTEEKNGQLELKLIPLGWRRSKDKKKKKKENQTKPNKNTLETWGWRQHPGRQRLHDPPYSGSFSYCLYSVEHKLGRAAHNSIPRVGLIIKYRSMLPVGHSTNSSMQTIHCCSPE